MKHEFHAQYAFALKDSTTQAFALDWLVGKSTRAPHRWSEIRELGSGADDFAHLMVLSQAIATGYKDQARVGGRRDPGGLYYWIRHKSRAWLRERMNFMRNVLELETNSLLFPFLPDLSTFPPGSWAVRITFTLKKPYISKDDTVFYILDNPVKKEWVFKVPYVAPSQWKGVLRAVMVRQLVEWWEGLNDGDREPEAFARRRFRLFILFGDEKGEEPGSVKGLAAYLDKVGGREAAEHFRRIIREHFRVPENKPIPHFSGRLHFYPAFFDRIGLEVINPHARNTGAGKNPIYFECVPAGAPGVFTLLYVPLDAGPKDEDTIKADLAAVARGIKAMITEYGFGAKTSSGYGVADVKRNDVKIHANGIENADEVFRNGWEE